MNLEKNNFKTTYGTRWQKKASLHFKVPSHTIKYWFKTKKPELLEFLLIEKQRIDEQRKTQKILARKLGIE